MKKYKGPKERVDAAMSFLTSPEELRHLAFSEYIFVQVEVAANVNTPSDALLSMVPGNLEAENDIQLAVGLLRNPQLPGKVSELLINKISAIISSILPRDFYSIMMIERLFENTSIPINPLLELLNSDSFPKHLKGRIARVETRDEVLEALQKDISEKVRARASKALGRKKNDNL